MTLSAILSRESHTGTESSMPALVRQSLLQTQRLLIRWVRSPLTLLETLIIPCLLLIMLDTVIGGQIATFTGESALSGSVPMVTLVAALSGAVASGVLLGRERDAGLLARFWVLPVHRASGLISRVLAEGCRIVVGTFAVVSVGYLLGFRFQQGLAATTTFLLIPLLVGLAFATVVTAVAVFTAKATLVEATMIVTSLMMFFSTGFVPLAAFPGWLHPIVGNQPMSVGVEAMRALAVGGPLARPLQLATAWSLGAIVVFAVPATIGYRRASRR
ncbi:ABC transporter permease [Nocardia sp. CNY236]|uniref:ABC transporter permease n=1 Tax=Nocardia sp. CNY236 TaxID=1169152 RepID=UPI00041BDA30|nr:ABC transporter permease [Nocardia sp. CNY236]